jgi:uncharacterized protein
VIIVDINLLIYANITSFPQHAAARAWWERVLSRDESIGLASPVIFGFIRVAANPRIFAPPLPVPDAVARVESWLDRRHVNLLVPGPRHLVIAFELLRLLGTAASLTTDVQLAALAIENQAELCSHDTDFARFPGLRWRDPLRVGS